MIAVTLALMLAAADSRRARAAVRPLGLGAAVVTVLTLPYAIPYIYSTRALGPRDPGEVANFSARLGSYVSAPRQNWLWGWTSFPYPGDELHLFPGLAAIALAVIGLIKGPRRHTRIYLVILAVAVVLSFGMHGPVYAWLYQRVRPLQGFRAPARFAVFACCALAVLAGFGFRSLRRIVRRRPAHNTLLAAVLVVIGVEDGSAPMILGDLPTALPDLYKMLQRRERAPIIEFPLVGWDLSVHYMYWSIHHWHPLVNGYSGYTPPDYNETRQLMSSFPDDASIERLLTLDVRYIVVHESFYRERDYAALMMDLMRRPEVTAFGRFRDWIGWAQIFELKPAR